MSKLLRLDKILSNIGIGSRNEIKMLARRGAIVVDGHKVIDVSKKFNPDEAQIMVEDQLVHYREFVYIMMNKPAGVISATEDRKLRTVLDLLSAQYLHFQPFPVGRLDKDTEGLLLLTNDGQLAHDLLSPRKHVTKTYFAKIRGIVDEEDVVAFSQGVTLDDGYLTKPASLDILSVYEIGTSEIHISITEGKFHQVKRMFAARGKEVLYLKRIAMGSLILDEQLLLGDYRELTEEEIQLLK